jgi:uncharacterized membrane protein
MKSEKLSKNRNILILLSFFVIFGFALRIYHLDGPSLWFDELRTAGRIHLELPQISNDLQKNPFPPLYYFLMHYWIKVFGDSESSLRFPSLIFSVLTIIFIFILAKEIFDRNVGLISALLTAISPYSIYYAQEAKMYSMLWLFGVISFLYFYRFCKDYKNLNLLLYILFTTIAIYTLYIGFIFIVIHNIAFFSFVRKQKIKKWLLGQLAIILLYLPWVHRLFYHINHNRGILGLDPPLEIIKSVFLRTTFGPITHNNLIELSVYIFLIVTAFVNITNDKKRKYVFDFNKNDYVLILYIIAPIVIYFVVNTFIYTLLQARTERYIGFIYLPLLILVSKGLNKYRMVVKFTILFFLVIVTLLFRILPLYDYDRRAFFPINYREFSHQLRLRADTNSVILTADLEPYAVAYYNKDLEIRPLDYIEVLKNQSADKNPSSVFILFLTLNRLPVNIQEVKENLKNYRLIETYVKFPTGFFWFKKSEQGQSSAQNKN